MGDVVESSGNLKEGKKERKMMNGVYGIKEGKIPLLEISMLSGLKFCM